jgi:biopolymer transport protein ExbD
MMEIPVRSQKIGLNLTPLIDIVFLLLVFFLLTTHFMEQDGIGVRLPSATGTTSSKQHQIALSITRDERFFIAGEQIPFSKLEQKLRSMLDADSTVIIRGDRDVPLQTAVSVMDKAKKAGAGRIVIATLKESGPP